MKAIDMVARVVPLVCAALVAGAVLVWAPVCSGTLELANGNLMPMRCAYTAKIALLLALILAVTCVVSLVTKRPLTVVVVVVSLAFILLTFETPLSIGVCKSDTMACQTTALWLRACGGVAALAALLGPIAGTSRKRVK